MVLTRLRFRTMFLLAFVTAVVFSWPSWAKRNGDSNPAPHATHSDDAITVVLEAKPAKMEPGKPAPEILPVTIVMSLRSSGDLTLKPVTPETTRLNMPEGVVKNDYTETFEVIKRPKAGKQGELVLIASRPNSRPDVALTCHMLENGGKTGEDDSSTHKAGEWKEEPNPGYFHMRSVRCIRLFHGKR